MPRGQAADPTKDGRRGDGPPLRDTGDRLQLLLPAGTKQRWKAEARRRRMSITALVQERMDQPNRRDT